MVEYIIIAMLAAVIILLIVLLTKKDSSDLRSQLDTNRQDMQNGFIGVNKAIADQRAEILKEQLEQQQRLNDTLSKSVAQLQESNEKKLEQMRLTVDEKLTTTLNQRLDSSFKTVGEQLQNVYRSLGEMKQLSSGVTDLQRLLTNVKARGTWAEVQLGSILEQVLTHDQYEQNVSVRGNSERVEFAVKIPSKDDSNTFVMLPIDSKFPQEDYLRLQKAAESVDKEELDRCTKALENIIKAEAKTISSLYINVPVTTDFAIMFLPTEGLYAEVLRNAGLVEEIQRKYRVMICGPTTITAFLNTLQMGFRTIALDKRASEVWKMLGAAKQQYELFATQLEKAKRKLGEASNALDDATDRNRIIQNKLRKVETLDADQSAALLGTLEPDFE